MPRPTRSSSSAEDTDSRPVDQCQQARSRCSRDKSGWSPVKNSAGVGLRFHGSSGSVGPLPAALVIGVLWAAWHLPMFLIPSAPQYGASFWAFCYVTTAWSIIMTALYNVAGASLIPTMLFHAASNGWYFVFNVPAATGPIELALYLPVVAIAVVALRRWSIKAEGEPNLR